MITAVSFENAHLCGPALAAQYRLRYKGFVERQDYKVSTYESMEYDQYDNPSSVYLVYQGENGEALGVSRLTPVKHRCMLKDLKPEMVLDHSIFESPTVWEGTRFCVDNTLSGAQRDTITQHIVAAYYEFGLSKGITQIIGMMPTIIWRRVLQRNGATCEILGPITKIDGQKIQAVSLDINETTYKKVLEKTNLSKGVIKNDTRFNRAA